MSSGGLVAVIHQGSGGGFIYVLRGLCVGYVKAGSEDDGVDLVLSTILGYDAGRPHLANLVSDDLDVRPGKCRVEVIGQQNALAAYCIVRRELCPEHRVLYLLFQVTP